MTRILDDIDRLLLTSKMVYLHCHAGLGRTGTVVGCYLARHAMATGQSALDRITHLRRAIPGSGRSPETKAQADFVVSWQPGE
jgi:protein-tyrosine phosphatase